MQIEPRSESQSEPTRKNTAAADKARMHCQFGGQGPHGKAAMQEQPVDNRILFVTSLSQNDLRAHGSPLTSPPTSTEDATRSKVRANSTEYKLDVGCRSEC